MTDVIRLRRCVEIAAQISIENPICLPIFARLNAELQDVEFASDPVSRARAMLKVKGAA